MTPSPAPWARALELRRSVLDRLTPPPLAWSGEGRAFGMSCSVDHDVVPGDYVTLTLADGGVVLGRLQSKQVVDVDGARWSGDPHLLTEGEDEQGAEPITSVSMALRLRTARGEGSVVGRLRVSPEGAQEIELGAVEPFDEATIERAPAAVVAALLTQLDAGRSTLVVGAVDAGGGTLLPAQVRTAGFNRHTFICGQSGSGKTFSLGVLLERLVVETTLRIVVLDPNGDFVRLGELRSDAEVDATRRLPAQPDEAATFRRRHAATVPALRIHSAQGDLQPLARLLDLSPAAQAAIFRLDPLADRHEYADAVDLMERLRHGLSQGPGAVPDEVAFDQLEDSATALNAELGLRLRNLRLTRWGVWAKRRTSVVDSIRSGARATIADLGALDTDAERYVLSLAVLEHLWAHRDERVPTLIVIDEAHTVAPRESHDPIQQMARELVIRIAGEGRKFGLFLTIASQRPDKVHPNVLSQCDNLILMRMNARADVDELVRTFSFVPEPLIRQSPFFAQGEAVIAGPIASGPTRLAFGGRYTAEGGSDLPTTWAQPAD